ncbi:helix-turn-helix transcriptional regulator [Cryptosporangium minutisporangium]|uniref:HTH luxR-type domain-containing protein n=1 Tax=Cryptosporangium minutisporangium TaxID=113569 RepID=A0ABP6STS0_9ACTN
MHALTARQLRAVLDAVYDINTILDDTEGRDVQPAALARFRLLVPADTVSYNGVDPEDRRITDVALAPGQTDLRRAEGFGAMLPAHPAFGAYARGQFAPGRPVALSDLLPARALRELPLYREVYRPAGVADHLLVLVGSQPRRRTLLTISRSRRGFRAADRAMADMASAHLAQAVARRVRRRQLADAARVVHRADDRAVRAVDHWDALTPREREVVGRLAEGHSDREIARILGVSPRTVHKHLEGIYRKLEIGSRTAVIAAYHHLGAADHRQRIAEKPTRRRPPTR